jgi:hypothetical protein
LFVFFGSISGSRGSSDVVFGLLILVRLVLVLVVWLVVLELLFVVLCLVCGAMSLLAGIAYVEA